MNSPTSIDDLPPEMISELFKHLQPMDLVACSKVSHRWHSIYAGFKVHRLAVFFDFDCKINKYHQPDQTIGEKELLLCHPAVLRRLARKPLLSNLKHLVLFSRSYVFDLNKLNRFEQLVHLEIHINPSEKKVNLNLSKLGVLVFHHSKRRCSLSIDCPQLSVLIYSGESLDERLLAVKQPETIRKLETDMFGPKLAPFKSVECLMTREFRAISKATLLWLPKLKELHYNVDFEHFFTSEFRDGGGTVDRMKRTSSEFMNEAKKLRGCDFQFSFCGFQLTKMDQIDFGWPDVFNLGLNECVYLKNCQLIEPSALPFVRQVNYSSLVAGEFPSCFFRKFTGLSSVRASCAVRDEKHFLWFLKSLRTLRSLRLERTELSQEFYRQLPASAPLLMELALQEFRSRNEPQLNFEFIGKLSRLFSMDAGYVSFESLTTSLLRSLGRLAKASFRFRYKNIILHTRKESNFWTVTWCSDKLKLQNQEEILYFFERLQM